MNITRWFICKPIRYINIAFCGYAKIVHFDQPNSMRNDLNIGIVLIQFQYRQVTIVLKEELINGKRIIPPVSH